MKVHDLPLEPIIATTAGESLAGAADRMRFYEIGSLAVFDRGEMVAILTERDITRAAADGANPARTPVRFYMTSEPATISADSDVEDARALMLALAVRHLPVLEAGKPVGMVSIRDLLAVGTAVHAVS